MAFDLASIFSGIGGWFGSTGSFAGEVILILVVVALGGAGAYWWYAKQIEKKLYVNKINLFKVVNGKKFWVKSDVAREFIIPGTNVRLFYWKGSKLYSAYPTRTIGFNVYAYQINRMGELTNFDLGETEDPTEARIDYDHRDQTYAYLNLQEFIKRNYQQREKVSWWKENIGLISNIVMLMILGLALWYFMSKQGQFVNLYNQASQNFKEGSQTIAQAITQASHLGSGVIGG